MRAHFLRAAKFPHADKNKAKAGEEIFFGVGVHEVPPHVEDHPYFKALVRDGHIAEPDAKPKPSDDLEQRKAAMLKKYSHLGDDGKAKDLGQAADESDDELTDDGKADAEVSEDDSQESEELSDSDEPSEKKKKKSKR